MSGDSPIKLQLLCAKEVAARLGVTPRVAAKMLRSHQIKGFKLSGKYWRTTEIHLEFYVARSMQEHAATAIKARVRSLAVA